MSIERKARKILGGILLAAGVLMLSACGGGDSGKDVTFSVGVTIAQLSGTWTGSLEDSGGVLHTFSVTIDAGSVTKVLIGGVDQGLSGVVTKQSDALFSVQLNGVDTRIFIDTDVAHAVFLDTDFNFGVLEKDTTAPLPIFQLADSDGNWAGRTLTTDFATFNVALSSGTCAAQVCSFAGNGVNASIELTSTFSGTFGNWTGTYTIAIPTESGSVSLLMSNDRNFAGFYMCRTGGSFPGDCTFTVWNRQ